MVCIHLGKKINGSLKVHINKPGKVVIPVDNKNLNFHLCNLGKIRLFFFSIHIHTHMYIFLTLENQGMQQN